MFWPEGSINLFNLGRFPLEREEREGDAVGKLINGFLKGKSHNSHNIKWKVL